MRLTIRQRENLAKTSFTLSHITFAGLIVTQIAMREKFDIMTFILGTLIFIMFVTLGIIFDKGGE